jgi:hypothetical protein
MDGIMQIADDLDSDGFIPQKAGSNQAGRSVLLRSIEINTSLTTFKGKEDDNNTSNAVGLNSDRRASRLGSPPTLPHSGSSAQLLRKQSTMSGSKFDLLSQAGIGGRRSSVNSNHSGDTHGLGHGMNHLSSIVNMQHHSHIIHDHANEHVRPMHKMLAHNSGLHGGHGSMSSMGGLAGLGGLEHQGSQSSMGMMRRMSSRRYERASKRASERKNGGRTNANELTHPHSRRACRNSLTKSPTHRKMSFLGNGMGNAQEAHTELTHAVFSRHLNIVATATTTGSGEHHCHVWDYETCGLVGTCIHPNALPGESHEVNALCLLSPLPYLLGAMNTGYLYMWQLPNCICDLSFVPVECVEGDAVCDRWCSGLDEAESLRSKALITDICVVTVGDSGAVSRFHESDERENVEQVVYASDEKVRARSAERCSEGGLVLPADLTPLRAGPGLLLEADEQHVRVAVGVVAAQGELQPEESREVRGGRRRAHALPADREVVPDQARQNQDTELLVAGAR